MTITHSSPLVELDAEAAGIITRLQQLAAISAHAKEEETELKARLRKILAVGQKGLVEGVPVVALQPNRRFDVEAGIALLPAELRDLCRADGYDPKKIKQYLAPALVETCMVDAGEPKVVLQ